MQVFKAKIDLVILVPIMAIMFGCTIPLLYMALTETDPAAKVSGWGSALFMLVVAAGCAHILLKTRYLIEGNSLIVQSSFVVKKTVAIASIRKVKETRTPISAPAPSLDRLEIFYNRFDSVIISPKDKKRFMEELAKINPGIIFA